MPAGLLRAIEFVDGVVKATHHGCRGTIEWVKRDKGTLNFRQLRQLPALSGFQQIDNITGVEHFVGADWVAADDVIINMAFPADPLPRQHQASDIVQEELGTALLLFAYSQNNGSAQVFEARIALQFLL